MHDGKLHRDLTSPRVLRFPCGCGRSGEAVREGPDYMTGRSHLLGRRQFLIRANPDFSPTAWEERMRTVRCIASPKIRTILGMPVVVAAL